MQEVAALQAHMMAAKLQTPRQAPQPDTLMHAQTHTDADGIASTSLPPEAGWQQQQPWPRGSDAQTQRSSALLSVALPTVGHPPQAPTCIRVGYTECAVRFRAVLMARSMMQLAVHAH
jgi:hypothetical protein